MNDKVHLLLIDDEKNYLLVLETLLTEAGYAVTALNDPETALAFLEESEVDIVITDMKMPRISGREVLERVKKNWPHIPVLIMTAFGSIESAVEAMRYGAFNYITKPFSNDELLLSIQNAAELARAHRQYQLLRESLEERYGKHQIIGRSRAIRDMLALVDRAGPSRATVLITGESGTGKELVARAIHFSSPRSQEPFVSVNCMALNPGVLESELFGHEKGSFTGAVAMRRGRFEQASGGTLFLDEVGELTPELQVKLLRVLQERRFERVGGSEEIEVDIRIVAATNKDLMPLVQAGTFREDLYYRLNVVHIPIPPLRERREDIPLLVAHFAEKAAKENGIPPKTFSTEALNHLSGYEWPGNIRQLKNVAEQISAVEETRLITGEIIKKYLPDSTPNTIPMVMSGSAPASEVNTERELLYKILFDLRSDMSEMKRMVAELLAEKSYDAPKSDIAGLLPRGSYPIAPAVKSPAAEALYTDTEEVVDDGPKEEMTKEKAQKEAIIRALKRHNGKRRDAARELFISERTLYRKIKELGIDEIP